MSHPPNPPERPRSEPTNEELARQEWVPWTEQPPEVSSGSGAGPTLAPYRPAVSSRSRVHHGSGRRIPAPVFRYREGRDSPGCLFGMSIPAGLLTLLLWLAAVYGGGDSATWTALASCAGVTVLLVLGAILSMRRNQARGRARR